MALITSDSNIDKAIDKIKKFGAYEDTNYVNQVSVKQTENHIAKNSKFKIALVDFGVKRNIVRLLNSRDCDVEVFPWNYDFNNLDLINFNGIVMSPGPGDPKHY